jgi:hypothetical protein
MTTAPSLHEANREESHSQISGEAFSGREIEKGRLTNENQTDNATEDSTIDDDLYESLRLFEKKMVSSTLHANTENVANVIKSRANSIGVGSSTAEVDRTLTAEPEGEAPLASIKGMGIADMFLHRTSQDYPKSEYSPSLEPSEPPTEYNPNKIANGNYLKWINSASANTTSSHTECELNDADISLSKDSLTFNNPDLTTVQALNEAKLVEQGKGLEIHPATPTSLTKHRIDLDECDVSKKRKVDMWPDISDLVDQTSVPPSHDERSEPPKKRLEERAHRKRVAKEVLLKARLEKEAFMKKIADAEVAFARRLAEEEEEVNSWLEFLRDSYAYVQ